MKRDGKQRKKAKQRMGHSRKVYLQSIRQNSKMAPKNPTPLIYKPA